MRLCLERFLESEVLGLVFIGSGDTVCGLFPHHRLPLPDASQAGQVWVVSLPQTLRVPGRFSSNEQ